MTRHERRKYESRLNNDVSADAIPAVSLIRHRTPRLGGIQRGHAESPPHFPSPPETSAIVLCLRISLVNVYFSSISTSSPSRSDMEDTRTRSVLYPPSIESYV